MSNSVERLQDYILQADLRHNMIPCGDCGFEEAPMAEQKDTAPTYIEDWLKRHGNAIESMQTETTRAIATLTESVKNIGKQLEAQSTMIEKIDHRQDKMEQDLAKYNNLRERVDLLEMYSKQLSKDFVPRDEFNGALSSVRKEAEDGDHAIEGQVATLKWVAGAIAIPVLGSVFYLVFGG